MSYAAHLLTFLNVSFWGPLATSASLLLAAAVFGWLLARMVLLTFRRMVKLPHSLGPRLAGAIAGPLQLALPAYALDVALPWVHLARPIETSIDHFVDHFVGLIELASLTWLLVELAIAVSEGMVERYLVTEHDEFRSRSVITQIRVFRRVLVVVLVVLALAIGLMSFQWGRELGGSLLASAGIAGLAVGLAARPTVENLVAGVQLALTQPMRIEDVVIVENEWGWIEEITTTYVVVRIWDLRRLVLPLTYFTQTPFQNWTRQTANLMGTVFVYVDYKLPVQAVRDELASIVKTIPQWDGKVCVLQVTDATNETVQLRALVSASDSSRLWDLRCAVREKLIEFIQRTWPDYLPRMRAEISGLTGEPPGGLHLADASSRSGTPSPEVR
ncbi:MAG: mechanosensitive ion channel [Betaproteobacteria bacterium]|nr:mechanosensitive ion channel [Betaproteobacteria bacterium]